MKNKELLRVVLDTNVILKSVSRKSAYRIILDRLIAGEYEVFITNDVLLEYEEKISQIFDMDVAELIAGALMLLENVKKTEIYYRFQLINSEQKQ